MRKITFFILLICACNQLQAQINYVLNGSFEQYSLCPEGLDEVADAIYWNGIDSSWVPFGGGSIPKCLPDYVNECSTWGATMVPDNAHFYQYPRTGKGMVQTVMYYDNSVPNGPYWDYLQGRLSTSLTAGQSYCVTFYINLDNLSSYATNNIGAYFDDGSIDTTSQCSAAQTQYTPQVVETTIISDTLNWVKVQGSFIAHGNERFITIGNFTGITSDHIQIGGLSQGAYLIDDVSVIASNAVADAGPDVNLTIGDTASIGVAVNGDGMPCYWYVAGNSTPIDSGGTIKVHPAVNTTYVVSMDLCGTVTYDTMQVNVHPDGIADIACLEAVTIAPNPAREKITINGLPAATPYRLLDMRGTEILKGTCSPAEHTISLEIIPSGIYLLELTAPGGGRAMKKLVKE